MVDSDAFRQPVVGSGGAVRRPVAPPRRTPFPEVESLVALVSSATKDASSIGDSNRNTTSGFVVTRFRGTRSHDRGTHGERIQSPVRHRLSAKVSAVQTKLRRCPCLAPVLEIHRQRSHRGHAASSAEVGQRERPRAVAVPSAVGWAVTLKPEPPPLGAVMPP